MSEDYSQNECFSIYIKPHKCVLKPLEQGLFLQDIELRDHMSRFTLKMNVFPSIS